MREIIRYAAAILFFVLFVLGLGTFGYYFIETGWSLSDAFYMTVITVTTVGFGEVQELSTHGKYFTVLLIGLGLCAVGSSSALIAKIVVEAGIKQAFGGRRMANRIAKMNNHYIVCGYGRIGSSICNGLEEKGQPFVVVEINEELSALAEKEDYCVLRGDATHDATLKEAGVERALGIAAALNKDADNLFISLASRELNRKILVISRCEEPGVEPRILRAGADMVVSPLKIGGKHIAELITQNNTAPSPESLNEKMPSILGFSLRLFRHRGENETTIADAVATANALYAAAIKRNDGSIEMKPDREAIVFPGDSLVIFTGQDGGALQS